jgi:hypothetical protein
MLLDEPLDLAQLAAVEAEIGGQGDRVEPELGLLLLAERARQNVLED